VNPILRPFNTIHTRWLAGNVDHSQARWPYLVFALD